MSDVRVFKEMSDVDSYYTSYMLDDSLLGLDEWLLIKNFGATRHYSIYLEISDNSFRRIMYNFIVKQLSVHYLRIWTESPCVIS